jgi:hypothetical protein
MDRAAFDAAYNNSAAVAEALTGSNAVQDPSLVFGTVRLRTRLKRG